MTKAEKDKYTDEEIIQLILSKKDPDYFEIIYDRYAQKVYNKSLGFVKDTVKAQDITHDIFVKVYLKLGSFHFKAKFSTWLYAVTYNFCVNYMNKEQKRKIEFETYSHEIIIEDDDNNEKEIMEIQLDRLRVIMDMLNPEERMILLLKYQDELSIGDIEIVTELSPSAIKMRLKRSRDKVLQLYLDKYSHNIL